MRDLAENAKKTLSQFRLYLQYVKSVETKKINAPEVLRKEIETAYDSLVAAIRARQQQLLSQVKGESDESFKELWSQKEQLETVITALEGTISFAERSLQCSRDAELLALCPQIIPRLGNLKGATWDSSSVERIDLTNKSFQCTSLQPQISHHGSIVDSSPSNLHARMKYEKGTSKAGCAIRTYVTPPVAVSMKLATDSHSDLQLGKEAVIKLSLQLRPSMLNSIKVQLTTKKIPGDVYVTPTGSSLSYSINQIDQLTVTFIPIISGEHIITVTTRDGRDSVMVNVVGKPQTGAAVVPGPHYGYQLGASKRRGARGVITNNKEEGCVSVLWDGAGEPSMHEWGRFNSGMYPSDKLQRRLGHCDLYGVQLDI